MFTVMEPAPTSSDCASGAAGTARGDVSLSDAPPRATAGNGWPGNGWPPGTPGRPALCRLLAEDRDLADAVPAAQRARATNECLARVATVRRGEWSPEFEIPSDAQGIGLLVLDGLLIRRVGIDGRYGAELLGDGDLLRPWQGEDVAPTLPVTSGWRVIEPVRLAVLDASAAQRLCRYPQLHGLLVGRALARARQLAVNMAIVHQPRVDKRLHMLLWHVAGRWGRVRRDGVHVPFSLTHSVLADLTAARRPTVSSALADLSARGLVKPDAHGWVLHGEPPGELLHLSALPATLTESPPTGPSTPASTAASAST